MSRTSGLQGNTTFDLTEKYIRSSYDDLKYIVDNLGPLLAVGRPVYELELRLDSLEAGNLTSGSIVDLITGTSTTLITQELNNFVVGDNVITQRIGTLEASFAPGGYLDQTLDAAITTERDARISSTGALASSLDALRAEYEAFESDTIAAISAEASTRSTDVSALATRMDVAEASLTLTQNDVVTLDQQFATVQSRIDTAVGSEATARSTDVAGLAESIANVTATAEFALMREGLVRGPEFQHIHQGTGWTAFNVVPVIEASLVYPGGHQVTITNISDAIDAGLLVSSTQIDWIGMKDVDAFVVELEAELVSGTLEGAGIFVSWFNGAAQSWTRYRRLSDCEQIGNGPVRYRTVLERPEAFTGTFDHVDVYLAVNSPTLTPGMIKTMVLHRVFIGVPTRSDLGEGVLGLAMDAKINQNNTAYVDVETGALAQSITDLEASLRGGSTQTLAEIQTTAEAAATELEARTFAQQEMTTRFGTEDAATINTIRTTLNSAIFDGTATANILNEINLVAGNNFASLGDWAQAELDSRELGQVTSGETVSLGRRVDSVTGELGTTFETLGELASLVSDLKAGLMDQMVFAKEQIGTRFTEQGAIIAEHALQLVAMTNQATADFNSLTQAIADETSARISAIDLAQTQFAAELTATEAILQTSIDTKTTALEAEAIADAQVAAHFTTVVGPAIDTAVSAEATARTTAIANETSARTTALETLESSLRGGSTNTLASIEATAEAAVTPLEATTLVQTEISSALLAEDLPAIRSSISTLETTTATVGSAEAHMLSLVNAVAGNSFASFQAFAQAEATHRQTANSRFTLTVDAAGANPAMINMATGTGIPSSIVIDAGYIKLRGSSVELTGNTIVHGDFRVWGDTHLHNLSINAGLKLADGTIITDKYGLYSVTRPYSFNVIPTVATWTMGPLNTIATVWMNRAGHILLSATIILESYSYEGEESTPNEGQAIRFFIDGVLVAEKSSVLVWHGANSVQAVVNVERYVGAGARLIQVQARSNAGSMNVLSGFVLGTYA